MDRWFAECLPCRWRTDHDHQDEAIKAAEKHVYALHADVPPEIRAKQLMGHVQNRTVNAIATEMPAPDEPGPGEDVSRSGPFVPIT